jgi:minor extracellular serine protease Vpr
MRKRLGALAGTLVTATAISFAQTEQRVPQLENETSGLWFIELSNPPSIDGTAVSDLEREEAGFHRAAAGAGIRYLEGRHFRKLWNGLTVRAGASDLAKIRGLPSVRAVYPVLKVSLAQSETPSGPVTDLITAIKMTGVDVAQNELGLTGRGIRVAVMDTGIDYDHPDLGGCFGPGCRVELGYDFVGDDFDSGSSDPAKQVPHPDPDPDDCNGHGTHVAGIIGAHGGIQGVAPEAIFHAYRVFGCEGSTTTDLILAAMEQTVDDGADVLNMSLGSPFGWPHDPTAQGADRLVKHHIVVVASAGNDGALGLYGASAPGVGRDVIGVASFDNTHVNLPAFTVSPDNTPIGYIAAAGAPPPPETGTFPMARTGTSTSTADACSALPAGSLTGQVALIRRGTCSFYLKAFNAQSAGAVAVVVYNNVAGFVGPTVAGSPAITIPVVMITAANGVVIDSRLAGGPVSMTWTSLVTSEPQPTGGLISSFSSYGLPPDLGVKPDIGAPGGSIRSTLPIEQGSYGSLSGTSMSSPHVAGAVALLLEARPHAKPDEVGERLQNTARPHLWSGNPALGYLEVVHRQGAGLLEIDDAILADETVSPSSLALGEIERASVTKQLKIKRTNPSRRQKHRGGGDDDDFVTYTVGHQPALSTGANTFTPSFLPSFATVQFDNAAVILGKRGHDDEATIVVTITPPANGAARLFGGYITLTPDDGGPVLRVPYAGYNGDYQAIQVLTPTPFRFPWLAKQVGTSLVNQPQGASFTLQGTDVPIILFHLDHEARELRLEAVDAASGKSFQFAEIDEFTPRNSASTSFFGIFWDGTTLKRENGKTKPVPNGAYRLEMTVLKALADPRNPAHTEHWTSPVIVIARPSP